jgi:quinol-cytochrome oxidoreductase complex cytochrome b subunit
VTFLLAKYVKYTTKFIEVASLKNFIIFSGSFLVLFFLLQIVSGMLLTFLYTPDVEGAWKSSALLSGETTLYGVGPFLLSLLSALLAALMAYGVMRKIRKNDQSR